MAVHCECLGVEHRHALAITRERGLFLVLEKVETHLSHTCRKLDITSRAELPRALAGGWGLGRLGAVEGNAEGPAVAGPSRLGSSRAGATCQRWSLSKRWQA